MAHSLRLRRGSAVDASKGQREADLETARCEHERLATALRVGGCYLAPPLGLGRSCAARRRAARRRTLQWLRGAVARIQETPPPVAEVQWASEGEAALVCRMLRVGLIWSSTRRKQHPSLVGPRCSGL